MTIDISEAGGPVRTATQTVEAGWIDYNSHMNVAYYTLAFDRALDEIYGHLGIGAALVDSHGMGPMALQSMIHYTGELLEGERFHTEFTLLDADAKRIHVFLRMIAEADGRQAATYESLSLNVDLRVRRAAPFPHEIGARIGRLLMAHRAFERPREVGAPLGIRRRDAGRSD